MNPLITKMFTDYGRSPESVESATEPYEFEEFRPIWSDMTDFEKKYFIEIRNRPNVIDDLNIHGGRIVLTLIDLFEVFKKEDEQNDL